MDKTPTRRKLLRGTLAAPLVLTVASPSALGQAVTSFQECIARVADQPQPSTPFTSGPDDWYRKEVAIYRGTIPQQFSNQEFYLLNNLYYPVNSCVTNGFSALAFSNAPTSLNKTYWMLVYVDTSGNVVGQGPCKPSGGYAVSTSCWNSFKNG